MLRFTACAAALLAFSATVRAAEPPHSAELDDMIVRQARRHGVPEKLVRRIVMRESKYNPRARNHSFWGLMQISYPTARSMGFKGSPSQLLDPLVNLTYAVPYLANAFIIAGKQEDAAVRLYASGYYETAKSRNLLDQLRTADSAPVAPDNSFLTATARPVGNLITAVVGGPPAQQVAAAAPPALPAGTVGGGTETEPEVMMTSGKTGYQPPKKWIKDGGVTLIARGEQRVDEVAAYVPPEGSPALKATRHVASHGKTHKNTEFASLDAPPASAQAYAAPTDAALQQSAPQAAIAQATAGAAMLPVGERAAGEPVPPAAPVEAPAAETKPAKETKTAKAARAHAQKTIALKSEGKSKAPLARAVSNARPHDERAVETPEKKPVATTLAQTKPPQTKPPLADMPAALGKTTTPGVAVAAKTDDPGAAKWSPFGSLPMSKDTGSFK